jgi:hypothetical protein
MVELLTALIKHTHTIEHWQRVSWQQKVCNNNNDLPLLYREQQQQHLLKPLLSISPQ